MEKLNRVLIVKPFVINVLKAFIHLVSQQMKTLDNVKYVHLYQHIIFNVMEEQKLI